MTIDQQNVQNLLIGSSFLQLQKVKDACCSFLQERSEVTPVPVRPSVPGWVSDVDPLTCLQVTPQELSGCETVR